MTGYGRGEADFNGAKFSVELNSVNRKQSDIVVNLPRDVAALEPRIRQIVNESISRGRTSVMVSFHDGFGAARKLALDTELARSYHEAMQALQAELNAPGEITIGIILRKCARSDSPKMLDEPINEWSIIEMRLPRICVTSLFSLHGN